MPTVTPRSDVRFGLTTEERWQLLAEYQLLPRDSCGRVERGYVTLLRRKWSISKSAIDTILRQERLAQR